MSMLVLDVLKWIKHNTLVPNHHHCVYHTVNILVCLRAPRRCRVRPPTPGQPSPNLLPSHRAFGTLRIGKLRRQRHNGGSYGKLITPATRWTLQVPVTKVQTFFYCLIPARGHGRRRVISRQILRRVPR